jgi:uncharacterized membrane protein HdeD (DUF308 family)
MLETVARHWWILLLRGILALLLGVLALIVPGVTALALALLFGAYALIDGIFAIVAAIRMSKTAGRWGWLLAEGIAGAIFGIAALAFPGITLLFLIYIVAAWAILTGASAITTAWRVREHVKGEWLWILAGLLSIVFGLLVIFEPAYGLFAVVYTFAFYAILTGVTFIGLSLRLRRAATHTTAGI